MNDTNRNLGPTILKADSISLAFGGVKALTNISFEVKEHEILAIIGPNGAGNLFLFRPAIGALGLFE